MKNKIDILNFGVNYIDNMINIDTNVNVDDKAFIYSNINNMYKTKSTQGHGIQVDNKKLEKPLLKMCDKISNAIYEFIQEQKELNVKG